MANCYMCAAAIHPGEGVRKDVRVAHSMTPDAAGDAPPHTTERYQKQLLCRACATGQPPAPRGVHPIWWLFFWPFLIVMPAGAPVRRWFAAHPKFSGGALIVLGATGVLSFIWPQATAAAGKRPPPAAAILYSAMVAGGVYMLRRKGAGSTTGTQARRPTDAEIMRAAKAHGGRLTVPQAVIALNVPVDVVEAHLDKLAAHGACQLETSDDGVISYHFPGLDSTRRPPSDPVASEHG